MIERWKAFLADLGLPALGERYDRAMTHGIDLDEWIAWTFELQLREGSPSKHFHALPETPAELALHIHRQVLAQPAELGALLAKVPTLGNAAATKKALATPESELPQLQQHMQPSPLWMAWMETMQTGRVREAWDRVRLEKAGEETPAKA